jgi:hypothetical protein
MVKQSYQEVYKVIEEDVIRLGNKKLNEISKDYHEYFYKLKQEKPDRYERLTFDTNGHKPYSSDLECILTDLRGKVIGTCLYIIKKQ